MKRRNLIALVQIIANETGQILDRLNLSEVEGADQLLIAHKKLDQLLTDGPCMGRRKMIKQLGAINWADLIAPITTNPNRLVQHLYEQSTMAVKDSVSPNGMMPIQVTDFEHRQFAMLLGHDPKGSGEAVVSMDPYSKQNDHLVPVFARKTDGTPVTEPEARELTAFLNDREKRQLSVTVKVIGAEKNGKTAIAMEIVQHLDAIGIPASFSDEGIDTQDENFVANQEARLAAIKEVGIVVTVETEAA